MSWEWSQDAEQLPVQASDSLCLTMDSSVVDGLDQTELLVLGGCDAEFQEVAGDCSSISSSTRTYDPFLDEFIENQEMPTERFRAAAVNVSEHVYLFGGRDAAGNLTCNVDRYSVLTGEWTQLDVSQATDCFSDHSGVASDDGTIYLFGGYDQDYVAQTTVVKVEVSSDDTMTFSTTEAMTIKRGDHSCIRLPATTEVFCIGGFTEENWEYTILSSVERFDMETEQWESKASMVIPRADFGAGLVNGRITVVGGENDERQPMDDVEWYDPSTDCWTDSGELFDLPYKRLRYCAATVETDGRIFIFGGQAVDETDSEVYSIEDTVNWYQEVLVDTLSTSAASSSRFMTTTAAAAAGFAPAAAAVVVTTLVVALRLG
ncbi:conserved unknown protein [Ectocarpus siliculosus]|uniref:Attractin/MKLN-like beta-propeller domain-containing protein n=1 Tax=Ectocarpus siliculosus TaxID=2880 RepID=D7G7R5_ECTSI|nr:conserved unknown protein [Ectocarpus siliculosus]|eukprot:CBJ27796.1 conserved unknown protein [Ectocarpus siliculosus]